MANQLVREAISQSGSVTLDADGYSYFHNVGKEPYWSVQMFADVGQTADGYAYVQGSNNKSHWTDLGWMDCDGYAQHYIHVIPMTGANALLSAPDMAIGFIRLRYDAKVTDSDGLLSYTIMSSK